MHRHSPELDVAIVGASVAGCAAAIRFAQMGWKVVVLERKAAGEDWFKPLCTHFIQPASVPVLSAIGLEALLAPEHSVRTKARFCTEVGVIDLPGGYVEDVPDSYALNLERRVLDPALRVRVAETGGEIVTGCLAHSVQRTEAGYQLRVTSDEGVRDLDARMVVAADGRGSRLAGALGNDAERHPNGRAARFAYFSGIPHPDDARSLFILAEDEMTFVYPLPGDRTLLSVYVDKARAARWQASERPLDAFLNYVAAQGEVPSLRGAVAEGPLLGYNDYPAMVRRPVHASIAFVGDAAASLDPMAGVGCGFALTSADLLADAFADRRLDPAGIETALEAYETAYRRRIAPHIAGICGDSRMGKSQSAKQAIYESISADSELSAEFLRLTGRLVTPAQFQRGMVSSISSQRAEASA